MLAFARKLSLLGNLSADDLALVEAACRDMHKVAKREVLHRTGITPDYGIVVIEGILCRYCQNANEKTRQITSFVLPGDAVNLELPFDVMTDSIDSLTDCIVARLSPEILAELWARASISRALQRVRSIEIATLRQWLLSVGGRRSHDRFVHLLLELHQRLLAVGHANATQFDLPILQVDCAYALGLSLVHMNKSFQKVRSEGDIDWRRQIVSFTDPTELKRRYAVDLSYLQELATASAPRTLGSRLTTEVGR